MNNEGTARRQNTSAMPILPMITLLHEFLIVSCVLCVPQVDSSLYQIKHCLSLMLYRKYSTHDSTLSSIYVLLSHLRSKESQCIYITYCTGSEKLTRYTHCTSAYISLSQYVYLVNSRYCTPNRSAHYIQKSLDFFGVILYLSSHV